MDIWVNSLQDFKNYLLLEKGVSENTQKAYLRDLNKLKEYAEKYQEIPQEIDYNFLQNFIFDFVKANKSDRSQARLVSSIKSFFKYLELEGRREDNPADILESPKIGFRLPDTLSHDEIQEIINAVDLSTSEGERNKAILETLYGCGMRVSELINLKISDLFFNEGFIKIFGKGNKERLVPISKWTMKCINQYKDNVRIHQTIKPKNEDFLFLNRRGAKLTREMIFIIIKMTAEKAGIRKSVSPHTFRHSYASVLLKNGADLFSIQQLLGHESITTTEIYTHLDKQQLRDAIEKHHPYYKNNNTHENI